MIRLFKLIKMIDPTETHETVKEYTKEELFWNCENMPNEAINYVDELEKKIREINKKLQDFPEHQTYYINQIRKIIK